ncbi:MAG: hypothetical protein RID81_07070 [Sandaracinaceae bacterium]
MHPDTITRARALTLAMLAPEQARVFDGRIFRAVESMDLDDPICDVRDPAPGSVGLIVVARAYAGTLARLTSAPERIAYAAELSRLSVQWADALQDSRDREVRTRNRWAGFRARVRAEDRAYQAAVTAWALDLD